MNLNDKKFWENYWYYYKIHTFAGIFALILIITTVYQCATTVKPDFTALYVGYPPLLSDKLDQVQDLFAQTVGDVNGDGKKSATLYNIAASLNAKSEMDTAGIQKADIEIMAGDSTLIFADADFVKRYADMGALLDISERAKKAGIGQDLLINDKDGKAFCAVEISTMPFAQTLGLNKNKVYAAIRVLSQDKKNDKAYIENYNRACEMFDKILNGQLK